MFVLHAGVGRTWQLDAALMKHKVDEDENLRILAARARKLEERYDWWEIYDPEEGMRMLQGWSTGRTTPHLLEALHAYVIPRAVSPEQEATFVRIIDAACADIKRLQLPVAEDEGPPSTD